VISDAHHVASLAGTFGQEQRLFHVTLQLQRRRLERYCIDWRYC
jgi:hypothetical protein